MTPVWTFLGLALVLVGPARPACGSPGGMADTLRGPDGRFGGIGAAEGARGHRPLPVGALRLVTAVAVAVVGLTVLRPPGSMALAVAAAAGADTAVRALAGRAARSRASPELALTLDLVAVALRAGQPIEGALDLAAPAAGEPVGGRLRSAAGLLRLGADPATVWRELAEDPVLEPVAATARRSATSGVRLAAAVDQLAADVRAGLRADGERRANRVGVLVAAPLGLCFLPAFVCLGVVPTVVGIARQVLP